MRIAVLGLGEAGRLYSEGLAGLGVDVSGFDPVASASPAAIRRDRDIPAAVHDADLVISLVGAAHSREVLVESVGSMRDGSAFADLNTGAPENKTGLATIASAAGVPFADVAVMAPVPRAGVQTPLLASGDGAAAVTRALAGLGIPIVDVGPDAGTAAGLKMLRSVFMKGLAALVFESASAAESAGSRAWMLEQMAGELGPDGAALVTRLIDGTREHAARRESEMRDVGGYLRSLDVPDWMTEATGKWLHALAEDPGFPHG